MTEITIQEVQNVTYEVDGKIYKTKEEAEAALASLANVSEGLRFAQAQHPGLSERALRTKANLVGEYLDWKAAGEPVVEAKEEGEE